MNDDVVVFLRFLQTAFDVNVVRRAIHQFCIRYQCRRLRQPRGIPEGSDLAPRLIARAGAAVEAVEAGRTKKKGLHQASFVPPIFASNSSRWEDWGNKRGLMK